MKTIQHDTQSLRQVAIERYLRTCSRINGQHRQDTRLLLLLALVMLTLLCLAVVAAVGRRTPNVRRALDDPQTAASTTSTLPFRPNGPGAIARFNPVS